MDNIREAPEAVVETTTWAPKNGRYMDAWRMCVEAAKEALSAPVASDVRELAERLEMISLNEATAESVIRRFESNIESYAAERERKAREEEREACAERAVVHIRNSYDPVIGANVWKEDTLCAAIKEAAK